MKAELQDSESDHDPELSDDPGRVRAKYSRSCKKRKNYSMMENDEEDYVGESPDKSKTQVVIPLKKDEEVKRANSGGTV